MRNVLYFLFFVCLLAAAIGLGSGPDTVRRGSADSGEPGVPAIGRIQILNGCGISGAAGAAADFLRRHGFDVKNIGNADTFNYPFTIVASRTRDTAIANEIAQTLGSDKTIILRNSETLYDVTVYVGADFAERIQ
jgi:hypothetical protein